MTPQQYLSLIVAGGHDAERGLRGLFDLYAARLKGYFRRRGCSEEDAADLVQEVFIKVMRSAAGFRSDSQVSTWIWSIAHNCLTDRWRARKEADSIDAMRENLGDGWEDELTTTPTTDGIADMQDCVRKAFLTFSDRYPESAHAIQLATVEGWSMKELAVALDRTVSATREFISQCRKKLRPFLERCRELLPA